MTLEEYRMYKAILWLTIDNERLPGINDVVEETGTTVENVSNILKVLEKEGVIKTLPHGIKVIRDIIWCDKRNRPCAG